MYKKQSTRDLEFFVYDYFYLKRGLLCAMEVKVPFNFRADFLGIDKKDVITVVEIKSSVSDFRSTSGHNFIGHKNYYALPLEVYEKVKDEIPKHVGAIVLNKYFTLRVIKSAKTIDHKYPKNFMAQLRYNIETAKQSNIRRLLYHRWEKERNAIIKQEEEQMLEKIDKRIINYVDQMVYPKHIEGMDALKELLITTISQKVLEDKLIPAEVTQQEANDILDNKFLLVWEHQLKDRFPELHDVFYREFVEVMTKVLEEENLEILTMTFDTDAEIIYICFNKEKEA